MNAARHEVPDLADRELWSGGFLEATIVLGERADTDADDRLLAALRAAWSYPALTGIYSGRDDFGPDSVPLDGIDARQLDPEVSDHLYGWLVLPNKSLCVAGTCVARECHGHSPLDWLDVYLPLGGLAAVDSRVGAYPSDQDADCQDWLEPISNVLGEIARSICRAADARHAVVGFEVSGHSAAEDFDGVVPEQRSVGYVTPDSARQFVYLAPTDWR